MTSTSSTEELHMFSDPDWAGQRPSSRRDLCDRRSRRSTILYGLDESGRRFMSAGHCFIVGPTHSLISPTIVPKTVAVADAGESPKPLIARSFTTEDGLIVSHLAPGASLSPSNWVFSPDDDSDDYTPRFRRRDRRPRRKSRFGGIPDLMVEHGISIS